MVQALRITTLLTTLVGFCCIDGSRCSDECARRDRTYDSYIGNGICDQWWGNKWVGDEFNSAACDWDGGDCCEETCYSGEYVECGWNGYNCKNPALMSSGFCSVRVPNSTMSCTHPRAIDGNLNVGGEVQFDENELPVYIDIMFDVPTKVCALGIVTDWGSRVPSGRIEYSTHGTTFTEARQYNTSYSGANPPVYTPVEQNVFRFDLQTKVRKLRLIIDDAIAFPVVIFELQVWASPSLDTCNPPNPESIGDGLCNADERYNSAACNWDGGDCCEETCAAAAGLSDDCGNSGYDCKNPGIIFGSDYYSCSRLPNYWKKIAAQANVDHCRIGYTTTEGQWYIDNGPTCVAWGDWDEPCNATGYFCAGFDGATNGYGMQQMELLARIIAGDFEQSTLCPVCQPTQNAAFVDVCKDGSLESFPIGSLLPAHDGTPGSMALRGRASWLTCSCTEVHIGHSVYLPLGYSPHGGPYNFFGTYYDILAREEGLDGKLVTFYKNAWYYDGRWSCVGQGPWDGACNSSVVYCAGFRYGEGPVFWDGESQMNALMQSVQFPSWWESNCPSP